MLTINSFLAKKSKYKNRTVGIIFFLLFNLLMTTEIMADNNKYTVTKRDDSGYTIDIFVSKRVWKMITAEGFFPKEEYSCVIDVIGEGERWTEQVKGIDGYYYSLDKIQSKQKYWQIGYAWVDPNREHLYLNLYWISAPDKIIPAGVNGKYKLK